MKLKYKKLSILSLIGIFLISVMMCCCFTNSVEAQAQEQVSSCHQPVQDDKSTRNTDECMCDQSLATVKDVLSIDTSVVQIETLLFEELKNNYIHALSMVDAYQAPPIIYNTAALYIKHSILRI